MLDEWNRLVVDTILRVAAARRKADAGRIPCGTPRAANWPWLREEHSQPDGIDAAVSLNKDIHGGLTLRPVVGPNRESASFFTPQFFARALDQVE